jgi:hypothetical protein
MVRFARPIHAAKPCADYAILHDRRTDRFWTAIKGAVPWGHAKTATISQPSTTKNGCGCAV